MASQSFVFSDPRGTEVTVTRCGCRSMTRPWLPDRTKQVHLPFPADQRRGDRWRLHPCGRRFEHDPLRYGSRLPFASIETSCSYRNAASCGPMRLLTDDQPSRRSGRLETRRGVDHVPEGERLARLGTRPQRHHRLTRVDGGPRGEVEAGSLAVREPRSMPGPRVLRAPLARRHRPARRVRRTPPSRRRR